MPKHVWNSVLALMTAATVSLPDRALAQSRWARSEPLKRSAPQTSNGFSRLSPETTGIDLVHSFPGDAPFDLMTDQYSGSGVCVGDVDSDGLPDVFLTNYDCGNRLYKNLGDWRFQDITSAAGVGGGGRWCAGASFADIDADGDLDLFVCAYDAPNLLYVNDGRGGFTDRAAEMGIAHSGASVMMSFADYDRDGDLDGYLVTHRMQNGGHHPPRSSKDAFARGIIVANRQTRTASVTQEFQDLFSIMDKGGGRIELVTAGQRDILYRNDGAKFTAVSAAAKIDGHGIGLAATWWDFNEDSWPDLYVSNDYKGADQLYRNNRDGTFTDVIRDTVPHIPWLSMGSDLADVNNDGRIDFLATDMAGSNHFRQKMGMGDMRKDRWFLTGADPQQYMRNALFLNTGATRMMEVAYLAGVAKSDWTWSPKFGDLDNDGRVDLFVTNGMSRNFMDGDLAKRFSGWRGKEWTKTPVLRQRNLAFRNAGDLQFDDASAAWGLDQEAASYGAALVDLDRDGDLDIVHMNFDDPVSVWRNETARGNALLIRLVGGAGNSNSNSNNWGIGAKLTLRAGGMTQARYLTLARGFMSANEPIVHFGLGSSIAVETLTIEWPSGTMQELTGLEANHLHTIREPENRGSAIAAKPAPWFKPAAPVPGMVHRERPFDDYARQPLLPAKQSQLGPCLATDGQFLYLGGAAGQAGMLWRGEFRDIVTIPFGSDSEREDTAAVFFDADGDGDSDLYIVSGGVECEPGSPKLIDRLHLQQDGAFVRAREALPDLREAGGAVATADFDHDGDIDLFVGGRSLPGRYPRAADSHLLVNEGGRFTESNIAFRNLGMVSDAAWGDIDGDGWIDLVVSRDWGSIRVFLNHRGALAPLESPGLDARAGWWNTLALADLDGDGDLDIAAGNYGLNTRYHASPEHPALLFHSDLDGSGKHNIVEAEYESGILYPARGKSCSTSAMPALAKKFPTFRQFAGATLDEIYGTARLADSLRLEATTLESGVFRNDGRRQFRFEPFPRLAQAAPIFDIVAHDLDSDGLPDLYLVGNHFSPQPETGRMDGGISLLLMGSRDGVFQPVEPSQSGLVIHGDTKAAVAIDFNRDGFTDYLAAQNDGPLVFFERHPKAVCLESTKATPPK